MTQSLERRVTIVSYYLYPGTAIGGVRVHNLAQSLGLQGHDVRVITAEAGGCPECHYTRLTVADPTPRTLINRAFIVPDRMAPWTRYVWDEIQTNGLLREDDVLITSSWPFSTHLLGLYARDESWSGHWIAEFRDPWTTSPYYFRPGLMRHRRERALESRVMHSADIVVTVTDGVAKMLERTHHRPVACLYSPISEGSPSTSAASDQESGNGPLMIVHAGSLYSGRRDTRGFLRAIDDLVRDRSVQPGDLVAHFFGRPDRRLTRWVRRLHLEEFVRVHGLVSRDELRPWIENSDVLLLVRWPDERDRPFLPAKMFEYLSYRKPILIVNSVDGGEAEELVRKIGAGTCCQTTAEIRQALASWVVDKRRQGGLSAAYDEDVMLNMSVREFGRRYEQLVAAEVSDPDV